MRHPFALRRNTVQTLLLGVHALGRPTVSIALACVLAAPSYAQVATGSISGRVSDATGAVLPDATVTLTRTDTGLVLTGKSNGSGEYTFPSLQTGPYKVDVKQPGFKEPPPRLCLA